MAAKTLKNGIILPNKFRQPFKKPKNKNIIDEARIFNEK